MKPWDEITKAGTGCNRLPPYDSLKADGPFAISFRGKMLRVIASSGGGWDHVSVSLPHFCPTWDEMEHVKRLFFMRDEWAMQLHAPQAKHINVHPYCLHIWRPQQADIPIPPEWMV